MSDRATRRPYRPGLRRRLESSRGAALIGATLVLIILAMTVGLLAAIPYLETSNVQERETRELIDRVVFAITGDRDSTFGYLGDMGRLPPTLSSLVTTETPAFGTSTRLYVGMGWNGPYLPEEYFAGDQLRDGWGQALLYETTSSSGVLQTAVIRSKGPDGVASTSDDIASETIQAFATLKVYAWKDSDKKISPNFGGRLYYANAGAQASVLGTQIDQQNEDHFLFSSAHVGHHAFLIYQTQSGKEFAVATLTVRPGVENIVKIGYND